MQLGGADSPGIGRRRSYLAPTRSRRAADKASLPSSETGHKSQNSSAGLSFSYAQTLLLAITGAVTRDPLQELAAQHTERERVV
jgi:hypothetical protein